VLNALTSKGFQHLVIQAGPSKHFSESHEERDGLSIDVWNFKPSLKEEFRTSDLIISHAGSGSILDALRLRKPLIVIPNPTLLHNHQSELAEALEQRRHLKSSTLSDLASTIAQFDAASIVPFPEYDGARFKSLLDQEMGFEL